MTDLEVFKKLLQQVKKQLRPAEFYNFLGSFLQENFELYEKDGIKYVRYKK